MALTRGLAAIADSLDVFIDRIGRVTGWCSLAIVLVMAYNVLLRYFFRTGSVAMQELEWHLMAPICMLGLSYAILKDGHVRVDILFGRFPPRLQRLIEFVSTVFVRPLSLAVRLFANMLAGHITLKVFGGFVVMLLGAAGALKAMAPLSYSAGTRLGRSSGAAAIRGCSARSTGSSPRAVRQRL